MTSWSWTSFRAVLWAWSRRCRRTVPCRAATRETAALRLFDPRFFSARSCWPAASLVADALRWRGLGTCLPSEVVRNDATPMSMPVTAPVIGSGDGWTCTGMTTNQRVLRPEPSRFTPVSYTHLRAHETDSYLVCRLLLEKKKIVINKIKKKKKQ